MRLKHIKGSEEYVEKSDYVIHEPETYFNKWNEVFSNNNPIHVEIGMGRGDFVIGMALKHPEINFIGVELYDSVIYKALKKIEELNKKIDNLRILREDAFNIDKFFNHEVSRIYLNFSDPWPKARHEKRRLTSEQFLNKYDAVFKVSKEIFQKTDNDDLFAYSIQSLEKHGYVLKNVTTDLYKNMIEDNVPTEYEMKFASKGKNINRLEAYKS